MPGVVCRAIAVHTVSISACADIAAPEEVARGVGAVDLEAFVLAAVLVGEAHVMEHRPGVEQFRIEAQATVLPPPARRNNTRGWNGGTEAVKRYRAPGR